MRVKNLISIRPIPPHVRSWILLAVFAIRIIKLLVTVDWQKRDRIQVASILAALAGLQNPAIVSQFGQCFPCRVPGLPAQFVQVSPRSLQIAVVVSVEL